MVFHEASEEIALRHSGKQFKTSLLSRVKKILHSKEQFKLFGYYTVQLSLLLVKHPS
jgi:hypothetical protein